MAAAHLLEERLQQLEHSVLGNPYSAAVTADDVESVIASKAAGDATESSQETVVQKLADLQRDLDKVVDARTSITAAFDKLPALNKYTSAHYAVKADQGARVKEALVLNAHNQLMTMAAQLAVVDKYSSVLDSEHIVAAAQQPHISQVAANQIELAEQVASIAEEMTTLSKTYTEYMTGINEQLVYWDGILRALEAKKTKA